MSILGQNRQLFSTIPKKRNIEAIQKAVTDVGVSIATSGNWYEWRRGGTVTRRAEQQVFEPNQAIVGGVISLVLLGGFTNDDDRIAYSLDPHVVA